MLASIENGKLQMAKMNIETMLQLAVKSGNTSLTIKKDGKGSAFLTSGEWYVSGLMKGVRSR
ncbi:hypothetical protein GTU61_22920 [Klebsiella pneumoniae]|uniref:hypothetical protein n=1 Tax=Klebsiella pneumoniae TaxID=573 RepID=UPI0035D1281C